MDSQLRAKEKAAHRRLPKKTGPLQTPLQARQRILNRSLPERSRQKMGRTPIPLQKINKNIIDYLTEGTLLRQGVYVCRLSQHRRTGKGKHCCMTLGGHRRKICVARRNNSLFRQDIQILRRCPNNVIRKFPFPCSPSPTNTNIPQKMQKKRTATTPCSSPLNVFLGSFHFSGT